MSRYRRARIEGGTFFFTIALADRSRDLLVRHIDRLRQAYKFTADHYPFETVAICVLPDHLHANWPLPKADSNFPLRLGLIKTKFSRGLSSPFLRSRSQVEKRDKGIWQRRYWEHVIRNDDDLTRHVDYIHFNPVKHGYVSQVRDWPHSSFHRYVKQDCFRPIGAVASSLATLLASKAAGRTAWAKAEIRCAENRDAPAAFAHPTGQASI